MANLEADKAAVPSLKEPAPLPAPTKEPSRASSLLWTGESHTSKEIYTNVPGPSKQNQACHPQVEDAVIEEPNTPSLSPSAAWPTSPPTSKPNAALSARAPLQESPNLLSLRRDEKTETRTEPTNDHSLLTTLAHGRPAEVGPVSSAAIGHASAPAVVGSSQDLYGPQHVHFETPPPGYRYPYPNLQAPPPSPDPYYRAQQPMEPFLYYHEPVRGYAGFPHPDYGPMFDGQRESTYPYTGYNEQRKPPSTGYQDRAYDPPNPFAPRPVCTIRDTYIPISRRSRRISPPRRSWPTGPRTETMKNDFRSRFRAPGSPTTTISSDTDSEDSDFDVKGTTRIERRRPSRPPQSRATCLDEKLDKAASYLGGVEGRSKDSFFKPNTSEPATTLPPRYAVSRLSSSSAQTASTARSTNASSSKASRSTRSSTAVFSTALSGVSSITSFDSEEEGDKRDSGGRSVMGDGQDEENGKNSDPLSISIGDQGGKEQEEEPKLKFPKLTRVVVKSGSGNMVVKFGGSNTYLEGAAECSFMTAENGAMFEDSIVGTDTEDPLISFESAAEDTKETSLMDAIDSFAYLVTEEGSDKYGTGFVDSEQDFENETKRRESIRRGKQPEVSLAKDITSQQDYSSTARHQVPSGVLSFSNMVGHKLVPTPGSSLCAQDSFDDLDSGQGPEKRHFGRKAVTFDPYSSEDLDIFSDYMHGGTRYSKNGFQDHPSAMPQETGYTSATSDLEQRNFRQDKFSPLTPSRHPTPKPRGVTQEPRNNQGTHVYECIIRGCPEYFDQADLLAKHSYQHGVLWSPPSSGRVHRATLSTISSPSQDEEALDNAVGCVRRNFGSSTSWAGSQFSAALDDSSTVASGQLRSDMTPVRSVSRGIDAELNDLSTESTLDPIEPGPSSMDALDTHTLMQRNRQILQPFQDESEPREDFLAYSRRSPWQFLGLKNALRRYTRPGVASDSKRLEWTCGCGEPLYADFKTQDQGTLNIIAGILQAPLDPPPSVQGPPYLQLPPRASGSTHHMRSFSSSDSSFSRTGSRTTTGYASSTDASTFSSSSSNSSTPNFLELCVNTGEYLKELAEIELTHAKCDGDLFGAVQDRYHQIRGYRSKFWLLKPAAVSFVRFSVEQRGRVGIFQKPLALPPEEEVYCNRWIYDPCPRDGDPPIAEHLFLHYLKCTQRSRNLFWMLRMPRKLKTSILNEGIASTAFGWGVHIDEGPNYGMICWINFFGFALSGLFAAMWTVYKRDFQGAFGFACWFVAALNTLMFAMLFRWKLA